MPSKKWAIRNTDSGQYMYTSNKANGYTETIDLYRTRREAKADLKDCVHKSRRDQYEVVKYEPSRASD